MNVTKLAAVRASSNIVANTGESVEESEIGEGENGYGKDGDENKKPYWMAQLRLDASLRPDLGQF